MTAQGGGSLQSSPGCMAPADLQLGCRPRQARLQPRALEGGDLVELRCTSDATDVFNMGRNVGIFKNPKKSQVNQSLGLCSGGDCEIRTHGRLPVGSFQDCWFKPLTQVSMGQPCIVCGTGGGEGQSARAIAAAVQSATASASSALFIFERPAMFLRRASS